MISIVNLSFGYTKERPIFNEMNLHLPSGKIYGLLGKNGAGKSTLLKLISGLIFPSKGNCYINNIDVSTRNPLLLKDLYVIPEEIIVPAMTVAQYENLYSPFYPLFDQYLFNSNLKEFDIPKNQKLNKLSYGQKKKVLISFGLATHCKVVIMDEPTNGLDIPSKTQFRRLLAATLHHQRSFIISTHQVRDVSNLIDPVIILDGGKIVFYKSMNETNRVLKYSTTRNLQDISERIYYEPSLEGYAVISVNKNEIKNEIDLEILFNAILKESGKINELFPTDSTINSSL